MKSRTSIVLCIFTAAIMVLVSACSPIDNKSDSDSSSSSSSQQRYGNIEIPKISSEDTVMPTYLDISLYNVENYADIYLGNDYEFKVVYDGIEISAPSTYKEMLEKGFKLKKSNEYNEKSVILAGKRLQTVFEDKNGVLLDAEFYNSSNSSIELINCNIVKFSVPQNKVFTKKSKYGMFSVNGVTNHSAITDIIEYLGFPSHFYAVNEQEYYLDYFISKENLRSRITVYINPNEDSVKAIEFANY